MVPDILVILALGDAARFGGATAEAEKMLALPANVQTHAHADPGAQQQHRCPRRGRCVVEAG